MSKGMRSLLRHSVILLLYASIFLWITYPLVLDFGSAVIGSGPDPYQYIWNADVFRSELLSGGSPFHTERLAYPEGVSLIMHTYTPVIGLLNLFLANPYLSVNLAIFLSLVLGGFGAYLLAKDHMRSDLLAFICGAVFAFSPYITSHMLEHVHLLLIAPVPFFIRSLLRLFPQGRLSWYAIEWRQVWVLLLCAFISFFSDYYTTFFLIYASIFYLLYLALAPLWQSRSRLQRAAIFLGAWVLLHLVSEQLYLAGIDHKGAFYNTADLFSFLTPAPQSWFYDFDKLETFRINKLAFKGPNEQVAFLGGVLVVLSIVVPKRQRTLEVKAMRFLLLVFFFLAVPKMKMFGHSLTYSPTAGLHFVPFLNHIRNPSRFVEMIYLFLPLLTAYHIDRWMQPIQRHTIAFASLLVLGVEFWPKSFPMILKSDVDPMIEELSSEKGSVWYLPTGLGDGFSAVGAFDVQRLQDQIAHGRPMLGGYISRISEEEFSTFSQDPVLAAAVAIQEGGAASLDDSQIEDFIKRYTLGSVVLDKRHPKYEALRSFFVPAFQAHMIVLEENAHYLILGPDLQAVKE